MIAVERKSPPIPHVHPRQPVMLYYPAISPNTYCSSHVIAVERKSPPIPPCSASVVLLPRIPCAPNICSSHVIAVERKSPPIPHVQPRQPMLYYPAISPNTHCSSRVIAVERKSPPIPHVQPVLFYYPGYPVLRTSPNTHCSSRVRAVWRTSPPIPPCSACVVIPKTPPNTLFFPCDNSRELITPYTQCSSGVAKPRIPCAPNFSQYLLFFLCDSSRVLMTAYTPCSACVLILSKIPLAPNISQYLLFFPCESSRENTTPYTYVQPVLLYDQGYPVFPTSPNTYCSSHVIAVERTSPPIPPCSASVVLLPRIPCAPNISQYSLFFPCENSRENITPYTPVSTAVVIPRILQAPNTHCSSHVLQ